MTAGRIRTVKPEWLEDELLQDSSSDARVLSIGLVLLADDHGNGRGSEKYLAAQVFPGQSLEILREALARLVEIRYVRIYQVDGQSYFTIRNWTKHQRVDHPGKPRVPQPSDFLEKVPESLSKKDESLAPRAIQIPIPSYSLPDPIQSDLGSDLGGAGGATAAKAPESPPEAPEIPDGARVVSESKTRQRAYGEAPRPRSELMATRVSMADYRPLPEHPVYARELELNEDEYKRALLDLRDKYGGRMHDPAWVDLRFNAFLEQASRSKAAGRTPANRGGQRETDAQRRQREAVEDVQRMEAAEAAKKATG